MTAEDDRTLLRPDVLHWKSLGDQHFALAQVGQVT